MFKSLLVAMLAVSLPLAEVEAAPTARQPETLAGTWDLSLDKAGTSCRVWLRAQKSDQGDYFLGMPMACRHAMPALSSVGRWSLPDGQHLTFADPSGKSVVTLTGSGDIFTGSSADGTYTLKPVALSGSSTTGLTPVDAAPSTPGFATVELIASRHKHVDPEAAAEPSSEVAGRYAVMREKRDTGCMLTLDTSRASGGDRAALAPGCRDQGIVVFDPTAWQIVKGALVLTARAGHKTQLEKAADGNWQKDPKEGKPLGLKKL